MKKNFLKIFTTITVAAILAVGVSYVSAQSTNPQSSQPAPVVNAPIHTGTVTQSKMGDVLSRKVLAAPIGLFKKSIFLPGKNASLRIGSSDTATGTQSFNTGTAGATATQLNTMIFNGTHTEPVVLDLVKRSSGPAIRYINTGGQCTVATRLVNDRSSAFQFNKGSSSANIIARQVQLTAGNPAKDRVLVGDASGNARWATATVENGVVKFSSGTSPVITGLQCGTTPLPTCPAGTTGTPPNCVVTPTYYLEFENADNRSQCNAVPGNLYYMLSILEANLTQDQQDIYNGIFNQGGMNSILKDYHNLNTFDYNDNVVCVTKQNQKANQQDFIVPIQNCEHLPIPPGLEISYNSSCQDSPEQQDGRDQDDGRDNDCNLSTVDVNCQEQPEEDYYDPRDDQDQDYDYDYDGY